MKRLLPLVLLTVSIFSWSCRSTNQATTQKVPSYEAEEFFKNTALGGSAFSNDETKMMVSSNESGIFNLYEIDLATKEKKALTQSTVESFFGLDYFPNSEDIMYAADQGGNENNHLYVLKPDGSTEDLTPGENEKANFAGWSRDKESLYFISNRRNRALFDVYKMKISDRSTEILYQNDEAYNIGAMSDDETYLALTKSITTSTNQIFVLNRKTNQLTEISDPSSESESNPAGFSKDSKTFYYRTNDGKDFKYLVSYDLASGKREILMEKDWDISYSYLSYNEAYRVTGINEDGKTTIIIQDNKTGEEVDFPEIKDGDILGVGFSESENLMRLNVGSSKSSSNIYIYNFETKELNKITETLNPKLNPDHMVSAEVVRYPSFDGLEIPAIFYKPVQASAKNKVPALVWVHGGPGGQSRVSFNPTMQYLLNQGYALLAVNNRGSGGYGKKFNQMDDRNHGDKDLQDCIYGKKYLQGLDFIDKEKIGIIGGSYGGFMVMAAMTNTPEEFDVGVNLFGVTNWIRTLKSIPPYWEAIKEALYKEMGDPYSADSTRLYNISPVFHGNKVKNPVMVLQGDNDPRVLKVESDDMVAAIKAQGVPVEYVTFPDEGHGFRKKVNQITSAKEIVKFLDKYLKGEEKGA